MSVTSYQEYENVFELHPVVDDAPVLGDPGLVPLTELVPHDTMGRMRFPTGNIDKSLNGRMMKRSHRDLIEYHHELISDGLPEYTAAQAAQLAKPNADAISIEKSAKRKNAPVKLVPAYVRPDTVGNPHLAAIVDLMLTEESNKVQSPDTDKVSFRKRLARFSAWAGGHMVALQTSLHRKPEAPTDGGHPEKRGRSRKVAAVVLGLGAVGLMAVLAKDGIHLSTGGGGHVHTALNDALPTPGNTTVTPTFSHQSITPGQVFEVIKPTHSSAVHSILTEGQSPWSESVDYASSLGFHVNINNPDHVTFIDAVKDHVLRLNQISEIQSTKLPVGTRLQMPTPEQMDLLYKTWAAA